MPTKDSSLGPKFRVLVVPKRQFWASCSATPILECFSEHNLLNTTQPSLGCGCTSLLHFVFSSLSSPRTPREKGYGDEPASWGRHCQPEGVGQLAKPAPDVVCWGGCIRHTPSARWLIICAGPQVVGRVVVVNCLLLSWQLSPDCCWVAAADWLLLSFLLWLVVVDLFVVKWLSLSCCYWLVVSELLLLTGCLWASSCQLLVSELLSLTDCLWAACCWFVVSELPAVDWLSLSWLLLTGCRWTACCWLVVAELPAVNWLSPSCLLLTGCRWTTCCQVLKLPVVTWFFGSCLLSTDAAELAVVNWCFWASCCCERFCWSCLMSTDAIEAACCDLILLKLSVVNWCCWTACCQLIASELLFSTVVSEPVVVNRCLWDFSVEVVAATLWLNSALSQLSLLMLRFSMPMVFSLLSWLSVSVRFPLGGLVVINLFVVVDLLNVSLFFFSLSLSTHCCCSPQCWSWIDSCRCWPLSWSWSPSRRCCHWSSCSPLMLLSDSSPLSM